MDDYIDRYIQQQRRADTDKAGNKADDEGLGIEHAGHIALRRAYRTEDAYLLCALKDTDIGDDADHDRRDDK